MINRTDQKVREVDRPKVVRWEAKDYDSRMEPQYRIWRDRADNLGIQCLSCNKTFWTGQESIIDPSTGHPCPNCSLIQSQNILQQENQSFQADGNEPSPYPYSQPMQTEETE